MIDLTLGGSQLSPSRLFLCFSSAAATVTHHEGTATTTVRTAASRKQLMACQSTATAPYIASSCAHTSESDTADCVGTDQGDEGPGSIENGVVAYFYLREVCMQLGRCIRRRVAYMPSFNGRVIVSEDARLV